MEIKNILSTNDKKDLFDVYSERSEDVNTFLHSSPSFLIKKGIYIIIGLVLCLVAMSWWIRYPEIIVAKARLSSANSEKVIIARKSGKVNRLYFSHLDQVGQGDVLAHIESVASPTAVNLIKAQLDTITKLLASGDYRDVLQYFDKYNNIEFIGGLGELQASFQTFMQVFLEFKDFIGKGYYQQKRKMLTQDLVILKHLSRNLAVQENLIEKDIALNNKTFESKLSLLKDKVLSPEEVRAEESKFINKQLSLPQIKSSLLLNEARINDKTKEIYELDIALTTQKSLFIQAVQSMRSEVEKWEYLYLLKAPINGRLAYASFFEEQQEFVAGQKIFYVEPQNGPKFIEMILAQYNFGKVKVGQKVLFKVDAYPYQQYGKIEGEITYVSNVATDSGYLAKVSLTNGLKTSFGYSVQYKSGLSLTGEIIAENSRLLEKIARLFPSRQ
ncbi:HlyD family efflux transporter periplasmic adaptor subunit [Parasegetibacter sp. NRK P23]|uniref:HlyD family efflux transporter periplasmic adaptor subunit n=1 Tax=Parasegetibacter sp. NRK P23 TaxID=2942999 RepID=UPI0020433F0B|nr:HlyD family efflux transporter periplasmic adaptor subunit [Parasegetibacter sp. NRK P23]MCM5527872.1 HlyD family secretion protein [Parasegetibacter sp. NRK P23]